MKIASIETFPIRIPLKPERFMVSALGSHNVSEYLVLRILTDDGIEGAGEASITAIWSGETALGAKVIIDQLFTPQLIGLDPHDIEKIDSVMDSLAAGNWFAKSAIEMACWDIQGKVAGKPVYELLGGPVRDLAIGCRFSMAAYPPERARERAKELIDAGFTTIKVKVGTVLEEDVERVKIVREAIGPDYEIVIDANCGFDAPTAIEASRRMDENNSNVALFEQPTTNGDFAALAEVRQAIRPEVMADDIAFDLADARECIRNNACDVISVYPGKNGGIRKSKEIVDFAEANGVACSVGSNLELDVASAAMGHLVVACKNMQIEKYPGDIMGPDYHEFPIVTTPLVIDGPTIAITDRPGLGVEVDWDVVKSHLIP